MLVMSSPVGATGIFFLKWSGSCAKKGRGYCRVRRGIIPDEDIPKLKESGIAEIFTPIQTG